MEKLNICSIDFEKGKFVVSNFSDPSQQFTISADNFEDIIKTSKIENGIIYGDFEVVDVRKKPTLLSTKASKYFQTIIANKVKSCKPIKNLEIGKIYHSKNSGDAGIRLYLYLGKNYYSQIAYNSNIEIQYNENPSLEYGDCFIEISYFYNSISIVGNVKMAVEATPMEIEKFDKQKFEKAKSLLGKIFVFGDKEYVESKMIYAKLEATK